ncbi:hypothetical protein llap_13702 [Limosa lapponica baueri]|uniref:Uncharacterized protein n=1 Tax=Limosa lapponica baueri TaxID=1758121 RepID=A0A2I0TQC5_LIMLA|nr:hypothetical protein llap_13702 [Limosa lapponica baueri]
MVKSELYPAAYKCTYTASGSSRHFCTALCNATGWRSQSQVNAGLRQASFGPPILQAKLVLVHKTQLIAPSNDGICFPKTQTILGLNSLGKMCQLFLKEPPQQQWVVPIFLYFLFYFLFFFLKNNPNPGVTQMHKWHPWWDRAYRADGMLDSYLL